MCAVELLPVPLIPGLVVAVVPVPFVDDPVVLVGVVDGEGVVAGGEGDCGVGGFCGGGRRDRRGAADDVVGGAGKGGRACGIG